jgi:hypothetical protein
MDLRAFEKVGQSIRRFHDARVGLMTLWMSKRIKSHSKLAFRTAFPPWALNR